MSPLLALSIHLRALDLLRPLAPAATPDQTEIQLATSNGREDALELFRLDEFEPWQATQNGRDFERDYVRASIATREPHRWLFAGLSGSDGSVPTQEADHSCLTYDLSASTTALGSATSRCCPTKRVRRQPMSSGARCASSGRRASTCSAG